MSSTKSKKIPQAFRYEISGSGGTPESNNSLVNALAQIIKHPRFQGTNKEDTSIVVHQHPFRDIHRSARDVAACPYPPEVKLVILLRSVSFRSINRSVPDWAESEEGSFRVLCLDPVPGIHETLDAMLNWVDDQADPKDRTGGASNTLPEGISEEGLCSLLKHSLGGDWNLEEIKEELKEVPQHRKIADLDGTEFSEHLNLKDAFSGKRTHCLMEVLQVLSNDAAESLHDYKGKLDQPYAGGDGADPKKVGIKQGFQMHRFLEFWSDLRIAVEGIEQLRRIGSDLKNGSILIIDDHPRQELQEFAKVIGEHLFGEEDVVGFFNPMTEGGSIEPAAKNDVALFHFFTGYQTLGAEVPREEEGEGPAKEFYGRLNREKPRFILVDQLFKVPERGRSEFLGPQFVRGLIRWMQDQPKLFKEGEFSMPEIIALSRTDEPHVIREAMRAGARAYVVKSRLVSLPDVLAKVYRGTWDRGGHHLHRNFRALYNLRNETIGLLQRARIPRIPFHSSVKKDSVCSKKPQGDGDWGDLHPEWNPEKPDKTQPSLKEEVRAEDWTDLLTRLPKTDLHVHAGSVMSREFLLLASLVMLARKWETTDVDNANPVLRVQLPQLRKFFHAILNWKAKGNILVVPRHPSSFGGKKIELGASPEMRGADWIDGWGQVGKSTLGERLQDDSCDKSGVRSFRASLQRGLGISDHIKPAKAASKLEDKDNLKVTLYLLRNASKVRLGGRTLELNCAAWKDEDLIRIYLLCLGSRYTQATFEETEKVVTPSLTIDLETSPFDFLKDGFSAMADKKPSSLEWEALHSMFWSEKMDEEFCHDAFKRRGYGWPTPKSSEGKKQSEGEAQAAQEATENPKQTKDEELPIRVELPWKPTASHDPTRPDFGEDPIGYTLASGTRSSNLVEYLLGCEFSGAEHLRHPFLIHVYARMAVMDWVRRGVIYAELKASPDGYLNPNIGFHFPGVCHCLIEAFAEAQEEALNVFRECSVDREKTVTEEKKRWAGDFLGAHYSKTQLRALIETGQDRKLKRPEEAKPTEPPFPPEDPRDAGIRPAPARLPVKASLIFVGKRHKSLREMILEAAGAAVLRPPGETPHASAAQLIENEFKVCRVVGFDLAGPEDGNPPSDHAPEFGRLNRLHLSITVHAGENAGAQFIEDSILELGAKRIGHGLSLAEDPNLMARFRDDGIVVELCPICNHQTSQFHAPKEDVADKRPYPLKTFLDKGIVVTLNTDNPIISNTDMVREFYQASFAYDKNGLSLWNALRLIRMGFVGSFLNLQERRHMLEIAEQRLFDCLSDISAVRTLRRLCIDHERLRSPES